MESVIFVSAILAGLGLGFVIGIAIADWDWFKRNG